jgi:hypothetical protein
MNILRSQVNREVKHYNLQVIISVGFKVNNERAVQFRKWANQIVKDFTIKGFAMVKTMFKKIFDLFLQLTRTIVLLYNYRK